MATTASSDATEGPVLNLINKRLRSLRKKLNRILQMEEQIAQGKPIKKEQEETFRSKASVVASIDELEKLFPQLRVAVQEEVSLAVQQRQQVTEESPQGGDSALKDLLNLLYFGSMFDVKPQSEYTSTMLTRTHERGCCLTYDYVTDEATDLLGEGDLDLISGLSGLLISRPADSNLSHKSSLERCFEHAKLWLERSEQAVEPNSGVTYAALRARLNKIMESDYFTATPEMKAPVDVAAAGNFAPFHMQVTGLQVTEEEEGSVTPDEQKEEAEANYQEPKSSTDNNTENSTEETTQQIEVAGAEQPEQANNNQQVEVEFKEGDVEDSSREEQQQQFQNIPRRGYQNQRGGGRGGGSGGRRAYFGGRGGRSGGRGGGPYQNGRNQYQEQNANYYPRNNNYYNNSSRGSRGGGRGGGGGHGYYNDGYNGAARGGGGRGQVDVGVAS